MKLLIRHAFFGGGKILRIGDDWKGGFYVGNMFQDDGIFALIVSPKEGQVKRAWKANTTVQPGARSTYMGLYNTSARSGSLNLACFYCWTYSVNGYDDWYLPAKDELELIYRNLKPSTGNNIIGDGVNPNSIPPGEAYTSSNPSQTPASLFQSATGAEALWNTFNDNMYWSSTQEIGGASSAWRQNMQNGQQALASFTTESWVRPVRREKLS